MTSIVDRWETAEGRACADCAHRRDRPERDLPPLNLCALFDRACLMIRAPGYACGPDARKFERRR